MRRALAGRPPLRGGIGALLVIALGLPVVLSAVQRQAGEAGPDSTLDRVTRYVQQYYGRAQSLVAEETVTVQPIRADLAPDGFRRRLVYEIRLEWIPASATGKAQVHVVRELLRADGRPPRPGAEPKCLDPLPISPEPLEFLLPSRRADFTFSAAGRTTLDGREAVLLDYVPVAAGTPTAKADPQGTGDQECIQLETPGRARGRLWVDAETDAVLRLDEGLMGPTDVPVPTDLQIRQRLGLRITVARNDSMVRYTPVTFSDPEERVMLPTTIESVWVTVANSVRGVRLTQEYRNYRRFLTASRIVE